MSKKYFSPGTVLAPIPAVMVSCGAGEDANIITIAWTGIVNSNPPMTYISVRKERHSHNIIKNSGEFVINLVSEKLAFAADWCGVKSGKGYDKWKEQKLTKAEANIVSCPIIDESPLSLECKVKDIIELGSHDMFLAEIVSVTADESIVDDCGAIRLDKAKLVAYNHGHYFPLKQTEIGKFGYSVMKPKTRKKYEAKKSAQRRLYARNRKRTGKIGKNE